MTFPTGWTHRVAITIDKTKVTGTPTGLILLVTKDMFPTAFIDAGSTSAQEGGGDIRFSSDIAGATRLPAEVVNFHPDATSGNRTCEIWVNMNGHEPSSSVDTVIYAWCKAATIMQQPGQTVPYGANAVWADRNYRLVHHMNSLWAREATGLWLIRPSAVEYSGATYWVWLDYLSGGTGNIRCAKYTHSTGLWTAAVTVAAASIKDAHGAPSICVDTSGYLHVTWGGYSNTQLTTKKSTNVADISTWDLAVVVATGGAIERTYPCMFCTSGGTLVLFSRENDVWHRRLSTDNGSTWSNDQTIISGGTYARGYVEWIIDASDNVYCTWMAAQVSPSIIGINLYYAKCANITSATSTWKDAAASTLSLPILTDGTPARVADSSGLGFDTTYILGVAVDGSGNPMLACVFFSAGTPANNCLKTWTYSGGWSSVNAITGANVGTGATRVEGGIKFVSGTTWRFVTVQTVSSVVEVQEYESTNGGASWSKIKDITSGSVSNFEQPQYVRGSTGPIEVVMLYEPKIANSLGYDGVHDQFFSGTHTDGVASWPAGLITATNYLRDSTKYRHDVGGTSEITAVTTFGGKAQSFSGANSFNFGTPTDLQDDLKTTIEAEYWVKHTSGGADEKTFYKGVTATAAGCMWHMYHASANCLVFDAANGSAQGFAATPNGGMVGGTVYKCMGYYDGTNAFARLNKTVSAGAAVTAPLQYNIADPTTIGGTITGSVDEARLTPTMSAANTRDTEYDNQNSPSTFATGAESPIIGGGSAVYRGRISIHPRYFPS